jgi:hypothetical protein
MSEVVSARGHRFPEETAGFCLTFCENAFLEDFPGYASLDVNR